MPKNTVIVNVIIFVLRLDRLCYNKKSTKDLEHSNPHSEYIIPYTNFFLSFSIKSWLKIFIIDVILPNTTRVALSGS